ncbi:putative Dipeptidyl-peptidase [Blattamonas nauphoetae]|uniref:Dipeptidyl-peptidase n=1 Tax=Blattamonas nauphoetae TaxID=2049346 RepID=A0ABQ9X8W4_9EUKA|nr:putative Dipeptidyl-peptidase [Blattamonas nauphoetae]
MLHLAFSISVFLAYALDPFTVRVNTQLEKLGEVTTSPDGEYVSYLTSKLNIEKGTTTRTWYIQNIQTLETITQDVSSAPIHDLVWTPHKDLISFISDDNTGSHLKYYSVSTKKIVTLFDSPIPISNLKWSPAENALAFSANVYPKTTLAETKERDIAKANRNTDSQVYDQLFLFQWDTWVEGKYNHVFYIPITKSETAPIYQSTGDATDVMPEFDGDCPNKPNGDKSEFDFSPNGQEIAFVVRGGRDQAWSLLNHIYVFSLTDKTRTCLTKDFPDDHYACPVFKPDVQDGSILYYTASNTKDCESAQYFVKKINRNTKTNEFLDKDCWFNIPAITISASDPDTIYANVRKHAQSLLVLFDATSGKDKLQIPDYGISFFGVGPNKDIVYQTSKWSHPPDLMLYTVENNTVHQLTYLNDEVLSGIHELKKPEYLWFIGANNEKVQGLYLEPPVKPAGKIPLILYVHGGPEVGWSDDWSYRWNPQTIAHQGYAVFAINFHGSDSYGQEFTDSILGRWGSWPFEDHMKGIGYILGTKPELDPERIGAMGASYGGFMINWMQGHTKIFKALVCHDGVYDSPSMYHETDQLYFFEVEFKGAPWEKDSLAVHFSPSYYADNFATPQLVIHGGNDLRVPFSQGLMLFTTLQGKGIPSRFVRFPYENHWVLNPYNSIRWHDEVIAWLKQYV